MDIKTHNANQRLLNESLTHILTTRRCSYDKERGRCAYGLSGCAFSVAVKERYRAPLDGDREIDPAATEEIVNAGLGNKTSLSASTLITSFSFVLKEWAKDCDITFARKVQFAHDGLYYLEYEPKGQELFVDQFTRRMISRMNEYNKTHADLPDLTLPESVTALIQSSTTN